MIHHLVDNTETNLQDLELEVHQKYNNGQFMDIENMIHEVNIRTNLRVASQNELNDNPVINQLSSAMMALSDLTKEVINFKFDSFE